MLTKDINKKNVLLCITLTMLLLFPSMFIKEITNEQMKIGIILIIFMNFILLSKINFNLKYIIAILSPFICYIMVELLNSNNLIKFPKPVIIFNLILYTLFLIVLYIIINSLTITISITSIFFYVVSITNYFVLSFRGRAIFPNDLYAIKTAFNVSENYNYSIDSNIYFITVILVTWLVFIIKYRTKAISRKSNFKTIFILCITSILMITILFTTNIFTKFNVNICQWYGNLSNGFLLNFTLEAKSNSIKKPDNYSTESIKKIDKSISIDSPSTDVKPNIIAIMNESFSDLSILGDFETNQDYMPFIRSLSDNTIKGTALASVHGGGTANSEFEFLTGNSMAFLPRESIAYQNYINEPLPSLVSTVKSQGYTPIAIHPFFGTSWNRQSVYSNLGFNKFLTQDDFVEKQYVRNYISDYCNYDKLIELFENKKEDERLFLFNVTVQNHGGYDSPIYDKYIYLTGNNEGKYPLTDQYLSIIYQSDLAFEHLINYFKDISEPTIIIMFGDHQPNIETEFEEKLFNKSLDKLSLDELQNRYKVPFVIWANYDIEEKEVECTSINYLSNYLLDCTSLKQTKYNNFLSQLKEEVPAINAFGYLKNGDTSFTKLTNSFKSDTNSKILDNYKILEYTNLFNNNNTTSDLYTVK